MTFMKEVLEENIPIWDQCTVTPFVREMQAGTLSFEKFRQYMIQDSIYLKHYARIFGKAIYHATTLKEIQAYYSILSFVTDTESAVRLNYLKQFEMTDDDIESIQPFPENQRYIDFMLHVAERGNGREILMAVLPCMLSYSYIFRKIAADERMVSSRYCDFIEDYADDQYYESCMAWCNFADEKCNGRTKKERYELTQIFKEASLLELDFWKMAYRGKIEDRSDDTSF